MNTKDSWPSIEKIVRRSDHAQQREAVEQLYRAIHQLPKGDAALVLLYFDELSYHCSNVSAPTVAVASLSG